MLVVAYLVAAWFPFDVVLPRHVRNDVRELAGGGVELDDGLLVSSGPAPFLGEVLARRSIDVRLEVRTARTSQVGPAVILAIAADDHNADLVIGQVGNGVVVQVRRPWSTPAGGSGFLLRHVLTDTAVHRLRVRVDGDVLAVQADDRPLVEQPLGHGLFDSWSPEHQVSLGSAPFGARPWAGQILTASVDGTDLLAPGVLERPSQWWALPWRGRSFTGDPNEGDVARNLLGFVPVGVVVGRRRWIAAAVAAGVVLSLVMEAGQLVLPTRDPSVIDVATNAIGALAGGVLGRSALRPRRPHV